MAKIKRSLYFSDRKRYYRNKRQREYYYRQKEISKKGYRTRQQIARNTHYIISARAIIINSKLSLEQLKELLNNYIKTLDKWVQKILKTGYYGYEPKEKISDDEDTNLKEGYVYFELNIRGTTTLTSLKL
jgi:hypothetical protein